MLVHPTWGAIKCHEICHHWSKINFHWTKSTKAPPSAASQGGGRLRRPPPWVCVSDHKSLWICLTYSLYIPYIFHIYFLDMFHCHPCIFPCVFLNLWSQERVRRWRKSEFWSNLARFGSRNGILTKWHNDSASFLLEKLKNQVILTKSLNI